MQPYFFPYLGHFALIAQTDRWVVFDVTQYTPKSWMSRNRVLHPDKGWTYINVPLANSSISITTCQAQVLDLAGVQKSLLGKLSHYRRKSPFYDQVVSLVNRVFHDLGSDLLVDLNTRALQEVCRYLELPFNYSVCSRMGLDLSGIEGAGEWAPSISKQLGADVYLNPMGGRELFDPLDFTAGNTRLAFLEFSPFAYETGPYQHESGLSILDVLMWNSPIDVVRAIESNSKVIYA